MYPITKLFESFSNPFSQLKMMYHMTLYRENNQSEEGSRTENLQMQRCRAWLDRLESVDSENLSDWNNTHLKQILVDYMLRMSCYNIVVKLAESSKIQALEVMAKNDGRITCPSTGLTCNYTELIKAYFMSICFHRTVHQRRSWAVMNSQARNLLWELLSAHDFMFRGQLYIWEPQFASRKFIMM